ncbi:ATP-dependent (S)-NAD(P)H-hydrate dehydratase [Roseimaritima multifibrata]|uniref:ADP-dependent (S)-NAD(P)H-hydrate dehydratase n=2 Tax=Roseimaritima multifibrata TaxID=1930274 RepID=A0A517MK06_9BACT|nr:ATP-dependent (S)-NAD(P)H-hydrate dehydratase [Roseimaritima multifibrata]
MSGAARLSALSALRGGVGLLTVATAESVWGIVAAENPAWMTLPLAEQDGCCRLQSLSVIESAWERKTALAVGPGLGQTPEVADLVKVCYSRCPLPLVLDADGLNAFVGHVDQLACALEAPRVLTPHPGELARLLGIEVRELQRDRENVAVKFARQTGAVVLLKGAQTVITDGDRLAVNGTGNSGLARGGAGDVLTGLIGALLAQGMEAFSAAQFAAHFHGLAADIVATEKTAQAMLVTELIDAFPAAWKRILAS